MTPRMEVRPADTAAQDAKQHVALTRNGIGAIDDIELRLLADNRSHGRILLDDSYGAIMPDADDGVLSFDDSWFTFGDMRAANQVLIRARALTGFSDLVAEHGGDAHALLSRAGIAPGVLEKPDATLPLVRVAMLVDDAAKSLRLPDFGLRLAMRQDISVLGAVALIALHAATVGEALRGIGRNLPYHTPGATLRLVDDARAGHTQLRYELNLDPSVPQRQVVELSYAVAIAFLRLMTGERGANWHVGFRHTKGLKPARYRKALGCPVQLGEDVDKLVFPTRLLDGSIDSGSAELQREAERFVSNVTRRFPLDVGQQVEALIDRQLAAGGCNIALVASQMGLHKRTLQRRLEDQGLHFEDIIDGLRRDRANALLPHEAIPLTQVGELLGYSEQSSFNRACHRWFGRTPQAVRLQFQSTGHRAGITSRGAPRESNRSSRRSAGGRRR
jgi:AraC-like DNA-binding protein